MVNRCNGPNVYIAINPCSGPLCMGCENFTTGLLSWNKKQKKFSEK